MTTRLFAHERIRVGLGKRASLLDREPHAESYDGELHWRQSHEDSAAIVSLMFFVAFFLGLGFALSQLVFWLIGKVAGL